MNSFPQGEFPHILATVVTMVITNDHKMTAWTKPFVCCVLCVCVYAHAHACACERLCVGKWMIYCFHSIRNSPVVHIMKEIHFSQSWAVLPQCQGLFSVALHCHSGWEPLDTQQAQRQQSSSYSDFTGGSHHDYSRNWLQISMSHSQTGRQCCWMYVTKKLTAVMKYRDTSPFPKR